MNQPWYVNLLKTLVFPLIKKKFRDRVSIPTTGRVEGDKSVSEQWSYPFENELLTVSLIPLSTFKLS